MNPFSAENETAVARESFNYHSNLLEKAENAVTRAKVTDSPINRQAELINDIRHRATTAQQAAQRQIVLKQNGTGFYESLKDSGSLGNYTVENIFQSLMFPATAAMQKMLAPRVQPTNQPKTTSTTIETTEIKKPISEEFHHPTPKPLFPLNVSLRLPTKSKGTAEEVEKLPLAQNSIVASTEGLNRSSEQQNRYIPMTYELLRTKTESTTPSAFGYRTTDWAKAFTSTEQARPPAFKEKSDLFAKSEGFQKGEQPFTERIMPWQEIANRRFAAANNSNLTVAEGTYETDQAKLRITTNAPGKFQERDQQKWSEKGPDSKQLSPVQTASTPTSIRLAYQSVYPTVPNVGTKFTTQQSFQPLGNGQQRWQENAKPVPPMPSVKSTGPASDMYLTKFGDQLNMEDLYWTGMYHFRKSSINMKYFHSAQDRLKKKYS